MVVIKGDTRSLDNGTYEIWSTLLKGRFIYGINPVLSSASKLLRGRSSYGTI